MQERHQCKIIIRGQGSNREGTARSFRNEPHEDDELPLHVSIEGAYDAVAKAEKEVSSLLHDPQSRHRLKQKQLSVLQAGDGQLALTNGGADFSTDAPSWQVVARAAKESEIPNFKGSYLGRFPLVSADFWTSNHLPERPRSVDAFFGTRARGTLTLKRR